MSFAVSPLASLYYMVGYMGAVDKISLEIRQWRVRTQGRSVGCLQQLFDHFILARQRLVPWRPGKVIVVGRTLQ